MKKIYATLSLGLILTVDAKEGKKDIAFEHNLSSEGYRAFITEDVELQKEIESTYSFNRDFILLREEETEPKPEKKIKKPLETEPKPDEIQSDNKENKEFPDVKSLQKAKIVLSKEIEGTTIADYPTEEVAKKAATDNGISFPNWK